MEKLLDQIFHKNECIMFSFPIQELSLSLLEFVV